MKKTKLGLKILAFLPAFLFFISCNPLENDTKSRSILVVQSILGTDISGGATNFLQSDVVKVDATTKQTYVTADTAKAALIANLLDPAPKLGSSQYNDILVTHYVVTYSRSDGKNVSGVDVPYPIEGTLSVLVRVSASTTISFIIVKEVAKLEPPLLLLAQGRAEGVISCTAKVEFYGHDLANKTVKATGYLPIYFANYVDK